MATEVVMPRLSDTMDTGTVGKWLKQEGDAVKKGEVIAEIETDKSNMEMECYANGFLAVISVQEGESAGVGEPIAMIAATEEEAQALKASSGTVAAVAVSAPETRQPASAGQPAPSEPQPAPRPNGAVAGSEERIKASPLARRLAQENGIELVRVTGTGPGGRITKDDVQLFVQQGGQAATPPTAPATAPAAQPEVQTATASVGGRAPEPVEMTRMQQTIARRMVESKFAAPEFVLTVEADMTDARALLKSLSSIEGAPKIGPNDFLIKATAMALAQHPELNSGWENNGIVRYGRVNVGVAVAIPGGLIVPVIPDADQKSLGAIARASKGLIEKARNNKLAPSDYEGGTFTISNLGMYGIEQFTPIINAPEAGIMGVGSIVSKPVVVNGEIVVRERMRITLSCDHRVVNGSQGAEFLQTLRRLLENPMLAAL